MLRAIWEDFRRSETGQDLAEYCLITALIALVGLGILIHVSGGIQGIWGNAGTALTAGEAASRTGSGGATPATASTPAQR